MLPSCTMATLLSLHVTVYIDPANKTAFFEAFKPVFDLVVAEPELIFFEVYQSPDEPGKLSWVENWCALTPLFPVAQLTIQERFS
jgi:quinol monooxygenase YgiN